MLRRIVTGAVVVSFVTLATGAGVLAQQPTAPDAKAKAEEKKTEVKKKAEEKKADAAEKTSAAKK